MNFPQLEKLTEDLSDSQLDEIIRTLKYSRDTSKENRFDKLHIVYNAKEEDILIAIQKIKLELHDKLNEMSIEKLNKLADLMGIGFLNEPEDKKEMILILSTEKPAKIEDALKKLNKIVS